MTYQNYSPIHTMSTISNSPILKHGFNYMLRHNKSAHAPYHNMIHIMNMAHAVTEICNNTVAIKDYTNVLLAALFHDANHSEGRENDSYNIIKALNTLLDFVSECNEEELKEIDLEEVKLLIRTTEYPYVIKATSLSQQIIRDADLAQVIKLDTMLGHNICGLKTELGKDISWSEYMKRQLDFIKSVKMETSYMKRVLKETRKTVLDYVELTKKCIE